jgi:hypothetical protein
MTTIEDIVTDLTLHSADRGAVVRDEGEAAVMVLMLSSAAIGTLGAALRHILARLGDAPVMDASGKVRPRQLVASGGLRPRDLALLRHGRAQRFESALALALLLPDVAFRGHQCRCTNKRRAVIPKATPSAAAMRHLPSLLNLNRRRPEPARIAPAVT